MPIEAANQYLPPSGRMKDAFNYVIQQHFSVGKTIEEVMKAPWEKVGQATGDFFTAGVAYLANKGNDSYLQEIGTTMWLAVNQKRVLPVLSGNMIAAAIQLGVPPETAVRAYVRNDEPYVLFLGKRQGIQMLEAAYVLMPPHFIVKAQEKPVEALATMAWIGSHIRDMVNGRLTIDPGNFSIRAQATESHFLLHGVEENPHLKLAETYKEVMELYPQGVNNLSPNVLYKSAPGLGSTSPNNN